MIELIDVYVKAFFTLSYFAELAFSALEEIFFRFIWKLFEAFECGASRLNVEFLARLGRDQIVKESFDAHHRNGRAHQVARGAG